jgi:hypothetical protein
VAAEAELALSLGKLEELVVPGAEEMVEQLVVTVGPEQQIPVPVVAELVGLILEQQLAVMVVLEL